jgi:hypothetical protein
MERKVLHNFFSSSKFLIVSNKDITLCKNLSEVGCSRYENLHNSLKFFGFWHQCLRNKIIFFAICLMQPHLLYATKKNHMQLHM